MVTFVPFFVSPAAARWAAEVQEAALAAGVDPRDLEAMDAFYDAYPAAAPPATLADVVAHSSTSARSPASTTSGSAATSTASASLPVGLEDVSRYPRAAGCARATGAGPSDDLAKLTHGNISRVLRDAEAVAAGLRGPRTVGRDVELLDGGPPGARRERRCSRSSRCTRADAERAEAGGADRRRAWSASRWRVGRACRPSRRWSGRSGGRPACRSGCCCGCGRASAPTAARWPGCKGLVSAYRVGRRGRRGARLPQRAHRDRRRRGHRAASADGRTSAGRSTGPSTPASPPTGPGASCVSCPASTRCSPPARPAGSAEGLDELVARAEADDVRPRR